MFRIIGVFGDQTKVIRVKSTESLSWSGKDPSNIWSTSNLNTYLNGEYLTSLGTLADKIATTTWKVGGGSTTYLYDVPKKAYQYEVGGSSSITTYDAKIGLMYVSDYGFASDSSGWTTKLSSYSSNSSKDWLFSGWTISRISDNSSKVFAVSANGNVYSEFSLMDFGARPVFFLESSITYISGDGTIENPIRIN